MRMNACICELRMASIRSDGPNLQLSTSGFGDQHKTFDWKITIEAL